MYQPLDFSHERNLNIDELSRRLAAYYPDADFNLFKRAYVFAEKAHQGQKRSSGEDYIIHPINVAATLIKLKMDLDSIVAGLLHDVIEDCDIGRDEIAENFGEGIAEIVLGLTKISKIKFRTKEESQAENFRKMVVAMAKDIRVIIVKLADRMHNMRTLQYVSDEKQKKIAKETLDIYVPLASRLGINSVKGELEDLCLRFTHSEIYYRLAEKIAMKKNDRDQYIGQTIEIIKDKLLEYSVTAEVKGRPKHFYSIYKKMKGRDVDFEQIQDVLAFRIIVSNITECYKTLGIMHSSFKPLPGRFKDYIAISKINGYQSLHSTLIGPKAERIEIQIRTHDMDEVAETGVAAHWQYKEGKANSSKNLAWVDQLIEFNQNVSNNSEFMDVVKNDLDYGGVFIFTPNGDVRELRYGATPLDFAYAVHTEVGNTCVGAKVNGRMLSLRHTLRSGDTVEILTSKNQKPSKDWLNIVKSSRAKTKIKQYILKIERDRNKDVGKEIIEKSARLYGTSLKALEKRGEIELITKELSLSGPDEFFIQVGVGKIAAKDALLKAKSIADKNTDSKENEIKLNEIDTFANNLKKVVRKKSQKDNAVIVDGLDDVMVRIGRCCNPIPGDPIMGYITRGRGITVHTSGCSRIDYGELGRSVLVEWNTEFSFKHPVSIRAVTHDRPGILSSISKNINSLGINIKSAMAKSLQDRKGSFVFEIEVKDFSELLKVISNVESLEEVISVNRV